MMRHIDDITYFFSHAWYVPIHCTQRRISDDESFRMGKEIFLPQERKRGKNLSLLNLMRLYEEKILEIMEFYTFLLSNTSQRNITRDTMWRIAPIEVNGIYMMLIYESRDYLGRISFIHRESTSMGLKNSINLLQCLADETKTCIIFSEITNRSCIANKYRKNRLRIFYCIDKSRIIMESEVLTKDEKCSFMHKRIYLRYLDLYHAMM